MARQDHRLKTTMRIGPGLTSSIETTGLVKVEPGPQRGVLAITPATGIWIESPYAKLPLHETKIDWVRFQDGSEWRPAAADSEPRD